MNFAVPFSPITDTEVSVFVSENPQVTEVNLRGCYNVTDESLRALARCNELVTLNLKCCDKVTNTGLGYLSEGCPALKSLDLTHCWRVTDTEVLTRSHPGLYITVKPSQVRRPVHIIIKPLRF